MNLAKSLLAVLVFWAAWIGTGCSHLMVRPNGSIAGQERATEIIWVETYGRTDAPPAVRWITDLNCTSDINGRPGFMIYSAEGHVCREGVTIVPYQVEIALRADDTFSTTTLAHEFLHAAQMRSLIFDPLHKTEGFQPGGLVDRANEALHAEGL